MNIAKLTFTSLLLCTLTTRTFGFWEEGHESVGAIADQLIANSSAGKHVHDLLGDETLAVAALWADQAKGYGGNLTEEMQQFKKANPKHSQFHYTDIPFQEKQYRDDSVGATNIDLVHAINACIAILQGKPEQQTLFKEVGPKVALRLLAHYVGDEHQPLHVGAGFLDGTNFVNPNGYAGHYEGDQGGNFLMYGEGNLHAFWDGKVVNQSMTNAHTTTYLDYSKWLLTRPAPKWKTSNNYKNWAKEWADDSLRVSVKVHALKVLNETKVPDKRSHKDRPQWQVEPAVPNYDKWASDTIEQQIQLGGYRLAGLLKAIWPDEAGK